MTSTTINCLGADAPHSLDATHAASIHHAPCMAQVYDELVRQSGWSADEYQAWLARILKHELLAS